MIRGGKPPARLGCASPRTGGWAARDPSDGAPRGFVLQRCVGRQVIRRAGGRRGGGEDLPAVAAAHDPRCPVHVDPDRTGPGQPCPTGVDPIRMRTAASSGQTCSPSRRCAARAHPRVSAAPVEEHEERNALRIDLPTSEAREAAAQELVVQVQDVGVAILEALEESGGALDIREQERDRVTRDGRRRSASADPVDDISGLCRIASALVPWIDPVAGLCASSVLVTVGLVVGARSPCGARPGRPRGQGAHRDGPPTRRRERCPGPRLG